MNAWMSFSWSFWEKKTFNSVDVSEMVKRLQTFQKPMGDTGCVTLKRMQDL